MRNMCSIDQLHDYLEREQYEMNPQELLDVEAHLEQCPTCLAYLKDLQLLKEGLADMPLKALPDRFEEELHSKLVEAAEGKSDRKTKILNFTHSTTFKVFSGVAAVLIIAVVAVGAFGGPLINRLMGSAKYESAVSNEMAPSAPSPDFDFGRTQDAITEESGQKAAGGVAETPASAGSPEMGSAGETVFDPALYGKMIIRNGSINLEVNVFDTAYTQIEQIVTSLEGYIESADTYSSPVYENNIRKGDMKGGNLSLRIPSTRFDAAMQQFKALGTVTRSNISSYDVTENYIDTQSRIQNLEAREIRLRELLARAENIKDIVEIDIQLTNVRTEIDSLKAVLKNYDKSLQMSVIYVSLYETKLSESAISGFDGNLFERIKANLIRSINSVLQLAQTAVVGLFAILPFVLAIGVIAFVAFRILRGWFRRRDQKL